MKEADLTLGKLNRPESLSEMAFREVREAIVDGRLKPGDQLSEIRISNMLGISKTPVREALQQLKHEGLVQIDRQRGTSIFRVEESDISDIAEFRGLLELSAARKIFSGDRTKACREMRTVVEAMHEALSEKDLTAYWKLDMKFHLVLIEGASNRYIEDAYGLISAKIGALRTRAHDDSKVVDSSLEVHSRLMTLLEAGDQEAFCDLLASHIRNAVRDYNAWLARQSDNTES